MTLLISTMIVLACASAHAAVQDGNTVTVADAGAWGQAMRDAKPGTTILLAPGVYQGGVSAANLRGEPDRPIVVRAADPADPPVIRGGSGLHLTDPAHVELRDMIFEGSTGNGINIDDGGTFETPANGVVLDGLTVRDAGPEGNLDGIKLSGVNDFRVEGCTVERWGSGGSGIDMVGCARGEIVDCTLRHEGSAGSNGVQVKGGSRDVVIRRCRFEQAGQRSINVGGSTGLQFFRPEPQGYEAKDITVEDCTFVGSQAPIAFVNVDGAVVRHNTICRPGRFAIRILQETRAPGFVPSRRGQFTDNLILFRSDEMVLPINIGPDTAPETFVLARNAWQCVDDPARSQPRLELPEAQGVYGPEALQSGAGRRDEGPPAGCGE